MAKEQDPKEILFQRQEELTRRLMLDSQAVIKDLQELETMDTSLGNRLKVVRMLDKQARFASTESDDIWTRVLGNLGIPEGKIVEALDSVNEERAETRDAIQNNIDRKRNNI